MAEKKKETLTTYERTDEPSGKSFHLDWPKLDRPEIELPTSR
jgi:hypothetical protein